MLMRRGIDLRCNPLRPSHPRVCAFVLWRLFASARVGGTFPLLTWTPGTPRRSLGLEFSHVGVPLPPGITILGTAFCSFA